VEAARVLHECSKKSFSEWGGFLPWEVMLLIKWTLADYEEYRALDRSLKIATRDELINILNMIRQLSEVYQPASLYTNHDYRIIKFFRQIANQQLMWQGIDKVSRHSLGRSFYLFCSSDCGEELEKIGSLYQEKAGISILNFYELTMMLWTTLQTSIPTGGIYSVKILCSGDYSVLQLIVRYYHLYPADKG
jgi:hypothetical protein